MGTGARVKLWLWKGNARTDKEKTDVKEIEMKRSLMENRMKGKAKKC